MRKTFNKKNVILSCTKKIVQLKKAFCLNLTSSLTGRLLHVYDYYIYISLNNWNIHRMKNHQWSDQKQKKKETHEI